MAVSRAVSLRYFTFADCGSAAMSGTSPLPQRCVLQGCRALLSGGQPVASYPPGQSCAWLQLVAYPVVRQDKLGQDAPHMAALSGDRPCGDTRSFGPLADTRQLLGHPHSGQLCGQHNQKQSVLCRGAGNPPSHMYQHIGRLGTLLQAYYAAAQEGHEFLLPPTAQPEQMLHR